MSKRIDEIPDVEIDGTGKFKYIQIKVKDKDSGDTKLIVRGYGRCGYHNDILDEVKTQYKGFSFTCPGGGRIDHHEGNKTLFVYGFSQAYGQPDHSKAVELLKQKYPNYNITYSNEGY
ncbi:hypothetical protein FO519_008214 [Halicephalobus sp. NKZ332]|nr:hypothetical protein FO519_008214 [Halicephalobus sp. NKZ332]